MALLSTAIFSQLSIMNYLKLFVFSLCVVAISCEPSDEPNEDTLVLMSCMTEKEMPLDELEKFSQGNPTENQYCVMGCVFNKLKSTDDIEVIAKKFGGNISDAQAETVAKCYGDIKATDDCELGKELLDCDKKADY